MMNNGHGHVEGEAGKPLLHGPQAQTGPSGSSRLVAAASEGRVWFRRGKVLMKTFQYFDHQLRVLNKV